MGAGEDLQMSAEIRVIIEAKAPGSYVLANEAVSRVNWH